MKTADFEPGLCFYFGTKKNAEENALCKIIS